MTVPQPDPKQLLEGDGTVLDDGSGPQLCLGGVAESYPPQCGGIPLVGWDWSAVDGQESASGTTWGDFHVVGTYDGKVFTVSDVGPYAPDDSGLGATDFTTPCPEPEGGWTADDFDLADDAAFSAGAEIAQALPGYVALWVDYAGDYTAGGARPADAGGQAGAPDHERRSSPRTRPAPKRPSVSPGAARSA